MSPRLLALAAALALAAEAAAQNVSEPRLVPFASERELAAHVRRLVPPYPGKVAPRPAPPAPAPAPARTRPGDTTWSDEGIGPVYSYEPRVLIERDDFVPSPFTVGPDEHGAVKAHGDHLVVLRRGRLFTVRVGGGALRPVAAVDAFGPGAAPRDARYHELLVSGDRVVVVGFSAARGGTEIGVFAIDRAGGLRHRGTHHLRRNDQYTKREYAARIVDGRLVLYTPLNLPWYHGPGGVPLDGLPGNPMDVLPAVRRWRPESPESPWRRTWSPRRVYRVEGTPDSQERVLHTVTRCDIETPELRCESTIMLMQGGSPSYASAGALYLWTRIPRLGERAPAVLVRLPLDGGAPSVLGVAGAPANRLSFLESGDAHLNVLVRNDGYRAPPWLGARVTLSTALLRVPLHAFGDRLRPAPRSHYRLLPEVEGDGVYVSFRNRFVGHHLLYGVSNPSNLEAPVASDLVAVRWDDPAAGPVRVRLAHGTSRIEEMGEQAVVIGADERHLYLTGVRLDGRPRAVQRYRLRDASHEGGARIPGFFYSPDGEGGTLALPIVRPGGYDGTDQYEGSASVRFLRDDGQRFAELGALGADAEPADDYCVASCTGWYGDARPIFHQGRTFALLGYELVEGQVRGGRIMELRRTSLAPRGPTRARPRN